MLWQQLRSHHITKPTQWQVSPGTHVAVLALTGLEETPTACGLSLSFMAKSSPPSVLVKLQESLHRGNSTLMGFLLKTYKTPQRCLAHPFKEVMFLAFTAHPHDPKCFHSVLNLQENQRLEAHHGIQASCTILPNLHDRTQPKSTLFSCPSHQHMH